MKKIIFTLLYLPYLCFAAHPLLDEAKQDYKNGKYQKAYESYSRFQFYCFNPQLEDHINSFIGKTACEKKLGYEKAFQFNWGIICDVMVCDFVDDISQKIDRGIQESLYMQMHDELINQRK